MITLVVLGLLMIALFWLAWYVDQKAERMGVGSWKEDEDGN